MDLRGIFTTDDQGRYEVRTGPDYTILEDGPVGRMLRTTGRHAWRPAHIHLVASAPGYKTVTTHAFDAGSKYLDSTRCSACASPSSSTWRTARPRSTSYSTAPSGRHRVGPFGEESAHGVVPEAHQSRTQPMACPVGLDSSTSFGTAPRSTGTGATRSCTREAPVLRIEGGGLTPGTDAFVLTKHADVLRGQGSAAVPEPDVQVEPATDEGLSADETYATYHNLMYAAMVSLRPTQALYIRHRRELTDLWVGPGRCATGT